MSVALDLQPPLGLTSETDRIESAATEDVAEDFVDCYRRHYPRVVRALQISGTGSGLAEDIAQEAFARSFVHWRRVRHGSNPAGYVYRVAFRLARRRHGLPIEESLPPSDAAAVASGLVDVDFAEEATLRTSAEGAVAAMPPARRACTVLCLLAGLSTKEAARALGIKESTVRKQIERARIDLRASIAPTATAGPLASSDSAPSTPVGHETPVPPSPFVQ